jgi:hypothetical protein
LFITYRPPYPTHNLQKGKGVNFQKGFRTRACWGFNKGRCQFEGSCKFTHKCSMCFADHRQLMITTMNTTAWRRLASDWIHTPLWSGNIQEPQLHIHISPKRMWKGFVHVPVGASTKGGASSEGVVNSHTNVPCVLQTTPLQTVTAGKIFSYIHWGHLLFV